MLTLLQHPMCAPSRAVRLILNEYNVATTLVEEYEGYPSKRFLHFNAAATLPVLLIKETIPICGAMVIYEYLDETYSALKPEHRFFLENPIDRAEVRRLLEWFFYKFTSEVTRPLVRERIHKREMRLEDSGGGPNAEIIRKARANVKPHLQYISWLLSQRDWLAGRQLSYADFAGAASLSVLDYMNEIDWSLYPTLQEWYRRLKSRPCFRPLLSERIRGLPAARHYANLDF